MWGSSAFLVEPFVLGVPGGHLRRQGSLGLTNERRPRMERSSSDVSKVVQTVAGSLPGPSRLVQEGRRVE